MLLHFNQQLSSSVCGVMVSIDAFQALDPGSIPGIRTVTFLENILSFFFAPNEKFNNNRTLSHKLWCISPRGYEITKDELKVAESEITQICKL
jgi:hypothetical protein